MTLVRALSLRGGNSLCKKAEILLRIGTGAYLNAQSNCVNYALTPAQVVARVNAALATCNGSAFTTEASRLDSFNNAGCPLDQHGVCSHP
jgi:hypothetical protein